MITLSTWIKTQFWVKWQVSLIEKLGFSCLTETNLAPILLSRSVWKWFCFDHRRRTCDDYFPNSLLPIKYLGYVWDMFGIYLGFICVRPENQNHVTSDQWQNSADNSAENTPNAPKFIRPICLSKPKNLGFHWRKASLGVRSPWFGLLDWEQNFQYWQRVPCSKYMYCLWSFKLGDTVAIK